MEIVAAAILLFTLFTVSADRDLNAVDEAPVVASVDVVDGADPLSACGPGILYRNLSVPAQRTVYWNADGERCDPEGSP